MREILITNHYKKDLKKAKKKPRQDADKLLSAIETLATQGVFSEDYLPPQFIRKLKAKMGKPYSTKFLINI